MPFGRPDRLEILSAVESFLDQQIKPRIDGIESYHLRVAINLLRILRRELASSEHLLAIEREGHAALMPDVDDFADPNVELCRRIRSGRIDYNDPILREHLQKTVLEKLAIEQPKYPSYLDVKAHGWSLDV